MAFGFFKKNETADTIFMGGKVFTQNSDLPWAEAVACKDGLVLAVGDYEDLAEFEGKNTDIVDLEGGFMLPGYIDTCGHPVMKAFQDSCLFLTEGDLADIMAQVSEYAVKNIEAGTIFAYGYNEALLEDVDAERVRELLDEACPDRPAVVLAKSGLHCFINSAALDAVKAAAEEDEVSAITISYILGVLEPIDTETIPETVPDIMGNYCDRGFTSVFDCGAPDPFASLYQNFMVHLYQEEMLKQRFYGSLLVTRDVNPNGIMRMLSRLRTNCAELNGHIGFKTLKLVLEGDEENLSISDEVLSELCVEAGDKGFDIHIDALGEDAVDAAMEAMSSVRSAGYKKTALTLAHDEVSDPQELKDNCYHLDIAEVSCTLQPDNDWLCIENAKSVEEAVDMLTVNAALQLGVSSEFGSIEKGKHADFVIFDENPLDCRTLAEFKKLHSVMTVIDGNVVYDAEEDDMSQWFSMLTMQQY